MCAGHYLVARALDAETSFESLRSVVSQAPDAPNDISPQEKSSPLRIRPKNPASPRMIWLVRVVRVLGIALGGVVTVVGVMSLVGLFTENIWLRLGAALVLSIGLPAWAADFFLKRIGKGGSLAVVADTFAIVLLAIAIAFVAGEGMTKGPITREADRYARTGPRAMARVAYFIAGVNPVFHEHGVTTGAPPAASSASSAPSAQPGTK